MTLFALLFLGLFILFSFAPAFEALGVGQPVILKVIKPYTATVATLAPTAKCKSPIAGRIKGWTARCGSIGGSTPPTDVDLVVKNYTQSLTLGTTAVVDSSAIVNLAGVNDGPATEANRQVAVGDEIGFDTTVTGGSSPTAFGIEIDLIIVPFK